MITERNRIMIRDWLNQFSDRWPEEYSNLYNKAQTHTQFQLAILWKYIQWATLDGEVTTEIWDLIRLLEQERRMQMEGYFPPVRNRKVRYKIEIEEVTDGEL